MSFEPGGKSSVAAISLSGWDSFPFSTSGLKLSSMFNISIFLPLADIELWLMNLTGLFLRLFCLLALVDVEAWLGRVLVMGEQWSDISRFCLGQYFVLSSMSFYRLL